VKHYSIRTETQYVQWIKRFIIFHDKRHPKDMGAHEVESFFDPSCSCGQYGCCYTESGFVGDFVSLTRSIEHQSALAGWGCPRQNAAALAGGAETP
jgi:hypothetical protein